MVIAICIFGLLVGSFLNVCIFRIPRHQEIVYTPSHCMACGQQIKWYDLIPVISYLILRGRCRSCKATVSIQYPVIELINGIGFVWVYSVLGLTPLGVMAAILFSTCLVISVIDIQWMIIPNGILLFLLIVGLIYECFFGKDFLHSIFGFFAVSIPLLIVHIVTKGQMGMGDIKLMAVAGWILGWQKIILALFLGSVFGSVIGLTLIGLKVMNRKQRIPFGPFLSGGIVLAALYGDKIIQWYFLIIQRT
ncbi:prepilin peptidase [Vallitaleaceae bacterium 9-2]